MGDILWIDFFIDVIVKNFLCVIEIKLLISEVIYVNFCWEYMVVLYSLKRIINLDWDKNCVFWGY